MSIRRVEDMPVYQVLFALAVRSEKVTRNFGPDFRWLREQMLRSSESACANMTEGFYSQYTTEYRQCLFRSRREARETVTHLQYAVAVKQLAHESGQAIAAEYDDALEQLAKLIASIESKLRRAGKAKPDSVSEDEAPYQIAGVQLGADDTPSAHQP